MSTIRIVWMCCKCCIITLSGHCSMIIFSSERLQSILHFCRNLLLRSGQGLKSELVDWQNALINFVQLCLCCTFSPSFSPWQQSEPRQDTYVIFDSTDYRLQTALLGLVVWPSHADWSQPGQIRPGKVQFLKVVAVVIYQKCPLFYAR